ncbi:MAG: hypothetical protein ACT4O5_15915 [Gammaproteobacteria bacterium]
MDAGPSHRSKQDRERITRPERPIREQLLLIRPRETATFIGHVSKDRLEFRRAIRHRNSFCPHVSGRIVDRATGSSIEAVLRPHPFVLAFMLGWLTFMAPWAVTAVLQVIEEGASRAPVIALTMWGAIYPICMLGFVPEARRTLAVLHDIVS